MSASEDKKHRVILLPVDGSTHSDRAYQFYLDHVRRPDDEVKFVHVIEPIYTTPAIGMAMEPPPMDNMARVMDQTIQEGKKLCQVCMSKASKDGVKSHAFLHVDSKAGHALVKSITDHDADMIIVGNRGVSSFRRTFLGSVSEYILHHAAVPIIVVPPPVE